MPNVIRSALGHLKHGRSQEAIALLRPAIAADPASDAARALLAMALSDTGEHDEAIAILAALASECPQEAVHQLNLAKALKRASRHEEAAAVQQRAQELVNDDGKRLT